MGRPRGFDEGIALDRAAELFWRSGYEGASLRALLEATGLARASLYATFKDKQTLFARALARHHARALRPALAPLFDPEASGRRALEEVIHAHARALAEARVAPGCLTSVALQSYPSCGPEARRALDGIVADWETGFYQAIRRAQLAGEVAHRVDPLEAAKGLCAAYFGMSAMARAGAGARDLDAIARAALGTLGQAPA